jgi:hypothetical protein
VSILEALMSPPRAAVVVPVEGDSLSPGSTRWEAFFGRLRSPRVDVFGLYPILGPMHERDAARSPHFVSAHGQMKDRNAIEEGALRLRAWLYADGPAYDRIVFLSGGALTPIWSRGVAGTSLSNRIKIVPVRNSRAARGAAARTDQNLPGLESEMTRIRLMNTLGMGA